MLRRRRRVPLRLALLVVMAASLVVPSWLSPARAITIPITLARSVTTTGAGRTTTAFAPTHVAFSWTGPEGTGVSFRTFDSGEATRWRRAPEAHDMEHGDHHYSAVITVRRPSAIQWREAGKRRDQMGSITVDYINTVDGPHRRVFVPATAEAASKAPDIVTRAQWGADESIRRNCTLYHYRVQQLFVHHTVGINNDPHPKATMRSIYWYHTVRRGWCDIGYNFVISPDGRVFEGRWARRYGRGEIHDGETRDGRAVQGAHTSGYNSGSIGVSLMGNYSEVKPSKRMRGSLVRFLAWEARRHDLKPRAHHTYRNPATGLTAWLPVIAGHRDAGSTECPGNYVYSSLGSIRRDVARLVKKKPTATTLDSDAEVITFEDQVSLSGVVTKRDGSPMAESKVVLKRRPRPDTRWRKVDAGVTLIDGSFSFSASPFRNGAYKAVFPGDGRYAASRSDPVRVLVRAAVTLAAEGGTDVEGAPHFETGAEVPLSGRVAPRHTGDEVALVVKALREGVYERVVRKELVLDDASEFRHVFASEPGVYRARAKFPGDRDHKRGLSPPVDFVISGP